MFIRNTSLLLAAALGGAAYSAPLTFISPSFAQNGTFRTNWLSAMSITNPDVTGTFDDLADGNIHAVANVYPGLTITSSNALATVTSNTALLGGSNPIGLKAVALRENTTQVLLFDSPVDYFSLISIDAGSLEVTVNYVDNTTSSHTGGSPASTGNTGVFFGLYRNDSPQIASVTLIGRGGDSEWGLDNVEYGVVPEPASLLAVSAGLAAFVARRKKKQA